MLGYKAVHTKKYYDNYFSAIGSTYGQWADLLTQPLAYEIGQTTEPPEGWGPLTCFDALGNARKFVSMYSGCPIGEVAILEVDYEPAPAPLEDVALWNGYETCDESSLPKGTILASKITPKKEVWAS